MQLIKIKYFVEGLENITRLEQGDWIDLRSAEDYDYKVGDFIKINLGVGMQLPEGYEANVVPRGSTFKNFGIIQTNSMGVIDESYCGDDDCWFYPVYALRDGSIKKNDRICQFRIMKKMEEVGFMTVDNLKNKSRGGFGSTGTA